MDTADGDSIDLDTADGDCIDTEEIAGELIWDGSDTDELTGDSLLLTDDGDFETEDDDDFEILIGLLERLSGDAEDTIETESEETGLLAGLSDELVGDTDDGDTEELFKLFEELIGLLEELGTDLDTDED